jgi:hypothetical protein
LSWKLWQLLVDIVVSKGEVVAAKPASDMAPPIILVTLTDGVVIPAIKWLTGSCDSLNIRLQNRIYGHLKGKALEKALRVVMENGELNIAGEYGSIEINKREFKVDSKQQRDKEMDPNSQKDRSDGKGRYDAHN